MNRNELTIKGDGAVCLYSCEECGDVLLVCQLCGNETEHPDPDSHRTPECLYTVNLNIIWNHESDGGEVTPDVEVQSFGSETAARNYMGDLLEEINRRAGA